ncbi:MAG: proton-conducting transporter membrane subunit, partial [Chromatocurvus sp.]
MSLTLLIALPLAGGILAWQGERISAGLPRWIALATVIATLLYLLALVSALPAGQLSLPTQPADAASWLAHVKISWIPRFGIAFELAMDGLSLLMVVLTLLLGLVAIAASWGEVEFKTGFFQANLLWTLAGVIGVFLALDMLLFFLFWEVMLVPMYLLIAIWGHEKRAYAAMKFFIFTQVSGLLMLLSIVVLAFIGGQSTGTMSFSYFDLLLL